MLRHEGRSVCRSCSPAQQPLGEWVLLQTISMGLRWFGARGLAGMYAQSLEPVRSVDKRARCVSKQTCLLIVPVGSIVLVRMRACARACMRACLRACLRVR
eukprot:3615400-Alexandrium_andersonii.AAC.1